ncbi:MAG: NAD(P)-dependent oxidoreductase [Acidimicrobiales bacterium]
MQVAVVGLGKMGTALARRLLDRGFDVVVWDRRPQAARDLVSMGAIAARGLADVWAGPGLAMSFLADDDAVRQVYLGAGGLVESAPQGAVLVEMSTISPAASAEVAGAAQARRLNYVRCPVSGNPRALASGEATLIVSGDGTSVQAARPVLLELSSRLYHVGAKEEAKVLKLAVNSMLAASAEMLAELVTLSEALGIDRSVLLEVLGGSAVGSPFFRYKADQLVQRDYGPTFTVAMLAKDLRLAEGVAKAARVPLPVVRLVSTLVANSCEEGLGELDFTALLPHLQHLAGQPTDVPVPFTRESQ